MKAGHGLVWGALALALAGCKGGADPAANGAVATNAKPVANSGGGAKGNVPQNAGSGNATTNASNASTTTSAKGGQIDPNRFPRPKLVKGVYVTAWAAGGKKRLTNMMAKTAGTEINSFVIDVRDDGEMYFRTGIPLAKEVKAETIAVTDPKLLMDRLKKGGIYPIARIACFRDAFVPKRKTGQAVTVDGGGPWKDRSGHTWLDPYNKKNWEYLAATVDFALDQGFPEIQLDYVRFPSEGKAQTQRFLSRKTYPNPKAKPDEVIAEFCQYIADRVRARGGVCSADIFGIISSGTKDQGIGQTLEKVVKPFDLVCPMVYPSHYARGEYGIPNPDANPYAIIKASLGDFKRKVPNTKVRPWLQDFSLGVRYGDSQVRAQIKAAKELGYEEYLMWNAGTRYTWSAYKTKSGAVASR